MKVRVCGIITFVVSLCCCMSARMWAEEKKPSAPDKNPETIVWMYTDFADLRANAAEYKKVKGIDGFLFCLVNKVGVPRWVSGPEEIRRIYAELPQTVAALKKAGITANFVHAGIDDKNWNWFNEKEVSKIVPTFKELARVAKKSGCRGVAIDTEIYSCDRRLWDPTFYPESKRNLLRKRISEYGGKIADAILSEFPEAEILILPEGSYISMENTPGGYRIYELWGDFYKAMASRKPAGGITILTECSYHWTDPVELAKLYGRIYSSMQELTDDQMWWRTNCGIALGVGLLDTPETKVAKQTPEEFDIQWKTMGKLSKRYRFIFASEAGLTQLKPAPENMDPMQIKAFYAPLAPDADRYFSILRQKAVPDEKKLEKTEK